MSDNPELQLFILWEKARFREQEILDDIRKHLEIVWTGEMEFEGDKALAFRKFYGRRLPDEWRKLRVCGGGPFLVVVVRDLHPRYAPISQFRPGDVSTTMYELKEKYREWTNRGHKVHGTVIPREFPQDILRLTGHTAEEWQQGVPPGPFKLNLPEPEYPAKRLSKRKELTSRFRAWLGI